MSLSLGEAGVAGVVVGGTDVTWKGVASGLSHQISRLWRVWALV